MLNFGYFILEARQFACLELVDVNVKAPVNRRGLFSTSAPEIIGNFLWLTRQQPTEAEKFGLMANEYARRDA